jgi:hypothetical protein
MRSTEKEKAEFDQLYHVLTSLAQKGKPASSEELKHVMKGSSMTRKRHPSVHLQLQAQALGLPVGQPQAPQHIQEQASQASHESHDIRKRKKKQTAVGKTVVLEDPPLHEKSEPIQHMVHDILRMAEARQISKRDLWEAMKKEMGEECKACLAPFPNCESLADHIERSPLCQRWLAFEPHDQCRTLQRALPSVIQDCLETAIMTQDTYQCRTCLCRFPNKEELYQHLSLPTAILCNRYACYEFKKMIARI